MSEAYRQYLESLDEGEEPMSMRKWCQRPGKRNDDGEIVYVTNQAAKKSCDVNEIIKNYDKTGIISNVSKFEAKFGDMSGVDFKNMQDKVTNAHSQFMTLPSHIRARFNNDPGSLLDFMEDPANRPKAIELGLINKDWTEATDGLGEHVKEGENVDGSKAA